MFSTYTNGTANKPGKELSPPTLSPEYGFAVALAENKAIVSSTVVASRGRVDVFDVTAAGMPQFALSENREYEENSGENFVAADFGFEPADQPSFADGMLTIQVSGADSFQVTESFGFRSNGSGPGQITFGGTVTYGGVAIGHSVTNYAARTVSIYFNGDATAEAVQALIHRFSYRHDGDDPSSQPRWFDISLANGHGGAVQRRVTLTVLPVDDPSAAVLDNAAIDENLPSGALVGTLTATDPDDAGGFTFALTTGPGDADNHYFVIDGGELRTAASFNFEERSSYSIRVRTTNASGESSDQVFSINVGDANDAPVLNTSLSPSLASIQEDAANPAGTLVSSLLMDAVSDPDEDARRGIAIGTASNYHGEWQYRLNNYVEWQPVGSVSESAALLLPGWSSLRFIPNADFNGTVKMYYRAWDQTQGSPGERFDLIDNTGGANAFSVAKEGASHTVTPVNDPPKLRLSGSMGYRRDAAAITLAPYATVADIDSANLYDGQLRVWISDGASSSNRLLIGSGFTVDANNNVLQGSTIIGKRTSSGFGTNELAITFNYRVTPTIAQQLVRAITFKTKDGAAGQRTILFTLSDGDGGLSDVAMKKVNVT